MADITAILPSLPVERATTVLGKGPVPRSRIEIITEGALPGAEVMLQMLLEIRGEIGGPDKAKAEREAPVREFHAAPITYNGYGIARRPPTESVYLIANA